MLFYLSGCVKYCGNSIAGTLYTVEKPQHLFFIPAVEEEIFDKAIVSAVFVDHKIYRCSEIEGVEIANRYYRIVF